MLLLQHLPLNLKLPLFPGFRLLLIAAQVELETKR